MTLAADYYDGRSSRRHAVRIGLEGHALWIEGEGVQRREALDAVRIGERLGSTPRRIDFADGACCEVRDHAALEALLTTVGRGESRWVRAQFHPLAIAAALLLVLASAALFWWQGLPRLSAAIADRLPPPLVNELSDRALDWLERQGVVTSGLPLARQSALQARYRALVLPGSTGRPPSLLFRASGGFGANALTLPDGRIVMLDGLVRLAENDEELIAVLGHELGHAQGRHGLHLLVRHTLVAALGAWWFGDVSSLLAAAPAVIAGARYSRELEQAADDHAVAVLRANGIPPARLADVLERLEAESARVRGDERSRWLDYLGSHPSSGQRIRRIRDS